ncbi:hypothetical protein CLV51_103374 [Chitinophaga niastensis]|uniref:Uncharacterized protein n=1 Tax=Chitinophaga niastensis TaxID=536980 RepID=A0A2P8HJK1_CHINA|nr:hypothetical protein [Chitinophaga niastensis]PSL46396.1 hypothetical protein CLV51_103374 [Chitinophaga niastensis]
MSSEIVLKKLYFHKAGSALIVNAPSFYVTMLEGVSYDSKPVKKKEGTYDFVQVFATTQKELEKLIKEVSSYGVTDCLFWACYPKGTGKIKSDIKRETVWAAFELVDLQVIASASIDETWTALRARPADCIGK